MRASRLLHCRYSPNDEPPVHVQPAGFTCAARWLHRIHSLFILYASQMTSQCSERSGTLVISNAHADELFISHREQYCRDADRAASEQIINR